MTMRRTILTFLAVSLTASALLLGGCGLKYPNCKTNEDCRKSDQGQEEGKLFCVNGLCQQCKEDADCDGPGMECNAGVCEEIPNYCGSDADCSGDQVCRDNRCGPECRSNDDCEDGFECKAGSCEKKAECSTDADCSGDEKCREGQCVAGSDPTTRCSLTTIYFDYDSSSLSSEARDKLESNADCIKKKGEPVQVAGHCDERGNNEYNIALGERRARSAKDYLKSMGVSSGKIKTISYGEERLARRCGVDGSESCHADNRRVKFSWQ